MADTKFKKVIVSRRTDNIEIGSPQQKDFVKQSGYVIIEGKPVMKSYTVILGTEVELPETIIEYIKERKVKKPKMKDTDADRFIAQYFVEEVK